MTAGGARPSSRPPAIGRSEVTHVARLARLALSDDELSRFTEQLASVLEYAAEISELDVDELEPMAHPLPLTNVLRPDQRAPSLDRDEVLAAAPASEDGRFRVPKILAEEG